MSLPRGACDCHAHVFGPAARFAYAEPRSYTPDDAPYKAYIAHLDRLGCERGVLVQPSACGRGNAAMLDALQCSPQRLRGVAVGGAELTRATLKAWHANGVRGRRDGKPYYQMACGSPRSSRCMQLWPISDGICNCGSTRATCPSFCPRSRRLKLCVYSASANAVSARFLSIYLCQSDDCRCVTR